MTRFTVVWHKDAQDKLATIWLRARNRALISHAADVIDQMLGSDPATIGKPMEEPLRRLEVPPLEVLFSIRDQDRVVEVIEINLLPELN